MNNTSTLELRDGEAAVFGYGSLMSIASLEQTLGRRYSGPFLPCWLEGWRRSWDVAMPNRTRYTDSPSGKLYPEHILYLNVKEQPGQLLNGIMFVVTHEELEALDKREWIYDRREVSSQLRDISVSGGGSYVYVAKPGHVMNDVESPAVAAVRSTYLDILEDGLGHLGESFRQDYERSTDAVPQHLVVADKLDEAP